MSNCGEPCGSVHRIAHGALGLVKAGLHIDAASADVREARLGQCRWCEHSTKHPTKRTPDGLPLVRVCLRCRCWIGAKVRVAKEACPIGLWLAVENI